MVLFLVLASSSLVFLAASCGGDGKNVNEPIGEIGEEEDELNWENEQLSEEEKAEFDEGKVEYEPVGAGDEKPTGTTLGSGVGPGTLKLTCKALGEAVVAEIKIMKASDMSVLETADGKSAYSFSLSAGTYSVDAIFHEAVDEPRLTLTNVEIPAGGKVERTFNFPMAKVKFIPVKSGTNQVVKGYKLRLKSMGGEDYFTKTITTSKDFVLISPGNYEGELFKGSKKKQKVIGIPSIQINEGSKAQKRIDVSI